MCCLSFFRANKIDQVGIGLEHLAYLHGPRLSVHLGVIYRDLDFQTPEVHPPEALRDCPNPAVSIRSSVHDPVRDNTERSACGFPLRRLGRWPPGWCHSQRAGRKPTSPSALSRRRGKAPSLHRLQPLALSLRPLIDCRDFFFGKLGTGMKDEISRQGHLPASQNG